MPLSPLVFSVALLVISTFCAAADTLLVMVEEKGCIWCARWNDEISEIYPKTEEGAAAPLRRIDIHATRPDDIIFARALTFTPTFVLVVDGHEISRIEGYPGEDFFWGLLGKMLAQANIEVTG
jgi:thioredoxin-related protein